MSGEFIEFVVRVWNRDRDFLPDNIEDVGFVTEEDKSSGLSLIKKGRPDLKSLKLIILETN